MTLEQDIKQRAAALGFDAAGITDARPIEPAQAAALEQWANSPLAADMAYMRRNIEKRLNPAKLLTNARSVICVGLNYKPPAHNRAALRGPLVGRVAAYAQYEDYHDFMKKWLLRLAAGIAELAGHTHKFKICVDSAPVAERARAARAGLGFIGRNHMLIHPVLGPQIFLGEIITTAPLKPDRPCTTEQLCKNCNKCIDACPTGALAPDGRFNAARCISYLLIEHKGDIAPEFARRIGDCLFGCDECVLACPFQQKAPPCRNRQIRFYPERAAISPHRIINMTESEFAETFADSPIKRLGLQRLNRNAEICLNNISAETT